MAHHTSLFAGETPEHSRKIPQMPTPRSSNSSSSPGGLQDNLNNVELDKHENQLDKVFSAMSQVNTHCGFLKDSVSMVVRLRVSKWYEDDSLWKKHWKEYTQGCLVPLETKDRGITVRFQRVLNLLGAEDNTIYSCDHADTSGWTKDKWLARLVVRVYESNRDEPRGIFFDKSHEPESKVEVYLKIVWEIVMNQVAKWRSGCPKLPSRRRWTWAPIHRRVNSIRGYGPRKRLAAELESDNQEGGELQVIWKPKSTGRTRVIDIKDVISKSWEKVNDEIVNHFDMTEEQLNGSTILATSTLQDIAKRCDLSETEVRLADLIDMEKNHFTERNWRKLQERALSSTHPLILTIQTEGYQRPSHKNTQTANGRAASTDSGDSSSANGDVANRLQPRDGRDASCPIEVADEQDLAFGLGDAEDPPLAHPDHAARMRAYLAKPARALDASF